MRQIKLLGLAILATLGLSAVATTAAQAIEGPFYRSCKNVGAGNGKFENATCVGEGGTKEWEKVRLEKGKIKFIEAKVNKEYVLKAAANVIKCKKQKLNSSSAINGSNGDEPGTGELVIELEECTVEGNGENCKVEKEAITTNILKLKLGYAEKKPKKGTGILAVLEPVKGNLFALVKFVGEQCKVKETAIEGTIAAEVQNGKEKTIHVEEEPAEEMLEDIFFPNARIKQLFVGPLNAMGEAKEVVVKLTAFGLAATLEGRSEVKLLAKEAWGIVAD